MRIVLVVVAATTAAFVVIWPQIQPRMDRLRIGMASLEKLDANGEGLVKARLTGSDDKGRPFVITADFVRQQEGQPGVLGLTRPRGEIEMEDGTKTVITAAEGLFHQDARLLDLSGGVVLVTGDGSRYETAAANFDLSSGTASGTDPVHGEGPLGSVVGEGFRVIGFGQTIFVDGRSTLVVAGTAGEKPS
ncbi:MAG: LPS export ABC transporter periplasmic protein LptC [Rhodospirillales bacterium]|nr:LPS export ABC transporter periplasmic protein LptC [Rhodospirillales bacterium]